MSGSRKTVVTRKLIEEVAAYLKNHTNAQTGKHFGVSDGLVSKIRNGLAVPIEDAIGLSAEPATTTNKQVQYEDDTGTLEIDVRHPKGERPRWLDVKSPEKLLRVCEIDTSVWEPSKITVSSSEVTMRLREYNAHGRRTDDKPVTYTNVHVRVALRRRSPEVRSLETLLEQIAKHGPVRSKIRPLPRIKGKPRRHLEVSVLDPHLGLQCYQPAADHVWTIDQCKTMVMAIFDDLLRLAEPFGPFERIIFPFGNDFLHADGVSHTTTQGTVQPDAEAWHHVYVEAEKLAVAMVDRLAKVAPVTIYTVPGNHDRQSTFTLGRLLRAYYHNDPNVEVHADSSPYKFHHVGVNLIGFEHGHSIRQTVRLAALMANECRDVWGQTSYREWHLGDQHRKGSAKPSMMEEQGVSVEFLPGLTPPNEWHRLKSFNWQKRAGMAFVWDAAAGCILRAQANIDSYTGRIMGT